MRKIYHSKKKNNYGHTYVGNHLYCDRFTLPSLIPSFLKKILNIKGMNSPLKKKITIVDGLGPSQILFIGRDPILSLINFFF